MKPLSVQYKYKSIAFLVLYATIVLVEISEL